MKSILKFFDYTEDRVRGKLSHYPITYSIIGGVAIVLFWRGVWHAADWMNMSWPVSVIISVVIMLATGLFVSFFIGDKIIIAGLRSEKKLVEKEEEEIKTEEDDIHELKTEVREIKRSLDELKKIIIDKK